MCEFPIKKKKEENRKVRKSLMLMLLHPRQKTDENEEFIIFSRCSRHRC